MSDTQAEFTDSALRLMGVLIASDEKRGRGYGGRALRCAADYAVDGNLCPCADCTLAFSLATAIGADRMARMSAEQLVAEAQACEERWAASLPEGGVQDDSASYRTIAANLRRLFPIS